jgi:hypothetical protein
MSNGLRPILYVLLPVLMAGGLFILNQPTRETSAREDEGPSVSQETPQESHAPSIRAPSTKGKGGKAPSIGTQRKGPQVLEDDSRWAHENGSGSTSAPGEGLAYAVGRERANLDLERIQVSLEETLAVEERSDRHAQLKHLGTVLAGDPEAALEFMELIKNHHDRIVFSQAVGMAMIGSGNEEAMNWGVNLPEDTRAMALTLMASKWVNSDQAAAIAWANDLESGHTDAIKAVMHTLRVTSPEMAGEWASQLAGSADMSAISDVLASVWAKTDSKAAYEWVSGLEDTARRDAGIIKIAEVLGKEDPASAAAWVANFRDPKVKQQALSRVVHEWSRKDPASAAAFLHDLPKDAARSSALSTVLRDWSYRDPQAAAGYVDGLAGERDYANLVNSVGRTWAMKNARDAIEWASDIENASLRDTALVTIAESWANKQPEQAANWALMFPDDKQRVNAVLRTTSRWAYRDPSEAAAFLAEQAPKENASAYASVGSIWARNGVPQQAAEWANDIDDSTVRNRTLENIGRSWMKKDPETASDWVVKSKLPEEAKQRLLAQP